MECRRCMYYNNIFHYCIWWGMPVEGSDGACKSYKLEVNRPD